MPPALVAVIALVVFNVLVAAVLLWRTRER